MDPYFTPRRRARTGAEEAADTPLFAAAASAPVRPAPPAPERQPAGALPHNGTATSQLAAERMTGFAGSDRRRIYEWVRRRGLTGATRKEIAAALEMSENTVNPRVRELVVTGALAPWGRRDGFEVVAAKELP